MQITELTPFHIGIIMVHFLNDLEIRYWLVPSNQHDTIPMYVDLERHYIAISQMVSMGILVWMNEDPAAQTVIANTYAEQGRQVYATGITEAGKLMFNAEEMAKRTIN